MKLKLYDKIEIEWIDIVHDGGWHTPDDLEKFIHAQNNVVKQIAYFYCYSGKNIIIIDSYFADGTTGTIHKIPTSVIKKITLIKGK